MSTNKSDEILPVTKKLSYTQKKVIQFHYTWVILYESELLHSNFKCQSPIFSPGSNEKLKLYLKMTGTSGHNMQVPIYICVMPCNISETRMKCIVSILKPNKERRYTSNPSTCTYVSSAKTQEFKVSNQFMFTQIENIAEIDGNIRIYCEIELIVNEFDIPGNTSAIKVPECQLLDNIRHLFESHKLSDVTIIVCGQELPAHKAILSVRSRVFSAMFEHEMSEMKLNRLNVTDVDFDVFKEMLRYIYTGEVPNIEKMAAQLLMAADKYELVRLKLMCEETLRANLTVENAANMLIFADIHNADQLKEHAIDFIVLNMTQVVESADFKSILDSHPYLIPDILRASAMRQSSGPDRSMLQLL